MTDRSTMLDRSRKNWFPNTACVITKSEIRSAHVKQWYNSDYNRKFISEMTCLAPRMDICEMLRRVAFSWCFKCCLKMVGCGKVGIKTTILNLTSQPLKRKKWKLRIFFKQIIFITLFESKIKQFLWILTALLYHKNLVWRSQNFLLFCITLEEYFVINTTFIFNLHFLCFLIDE